MFGAWIDDPARETTGASYWSALEELGVMNAALMIDTFARGFDTAYSARDIERVAAYAHDRDIALSATVVPEPKRSWIDDMRKEPDPLLALGFVALDNDVEGLWTEAAVEDFDSLDEAAVYLMAKERELAEEHDLWIEVDTHTGHLEASRHAMLVPLADRACFQLYSARHDWRHQEVAWGGAGGPGRFQRAMLARIRANVPAMAGPHGRRGPRLRARRDARACAGVRAAGRDSRLVREVDRRREVDEHRPAPDPLVGRANLGPVEGVGRETSDVPRPLSVDELTVTLAAATPSHPVIVVAVVARPGGIAWVRLIPVGVAPLGAFSVTAATVGDVDGREVFRVVVTRRRPRVLFLADAAGELAGDEEDEEDHERPANGSVDGHEPLDHVLHVQPPAFRRMTDSSIQQHLRFLVKPGYPRASTTVA
jgi:hypothetical protein